MPLGSKGVLNLLSGQVQVGDELLVGAAIAVVGLERRHVQQFADEREVKVQEQRAVEEEEVFAATLGVAGEF